MNRHKIASYEQGAPYKEVKKNVW